MKIKFLGLYQASLLIITLFLSTTGFASDSDDNDEKVIESCLDALSVDIRDLRLKPSPSLSISNNMRIISKQKGRFGGWRFVYRDNRTDDELLLGDIRHVRQILGSKLATFLGFEKKSIGVNLFSFPDEIELNGAIAELNRRAKLKGIAEIPFTFGILPNERHHLEHLFYGFATDSLRIPLDARVPSYLFGLGNTTIPYLLPPDLVHHLFFQMQKRIEFVSWFADRPNKKYVNVHDVKMGADSILRELAIMVNHYFHRTAIWSTCFNPVLDISCLAKEAKNIAGMGGSMSSHLRQVDYTPDPSKPKSIFDMEQDFIQGPSGELFVIGDSYNSQLNEGFLTQYYRYYQELRRSNSQFKKTHPLTSTKDEMIDPKVLAAQILERRNTLESLVAD